LRFKVIFSSAILAIALSPAGAVIYANSTIAGQSASRAFIDALRIEKPLFFCNEPVPLDEPEIRERLERELLFSLDNQDDIILWLKRANRYFPHIEKALKKNSLPDDLKYIAIAESALKPHAASSKGAVGYWQFIESTASKYGMEISPNIDDRRNFFTSTNAALAYLRDLHALFGSWTLAAAAYNMGEEGLKTEILLQKVNNFYQLHLPQETQRYIFRIISAKLIMSNPEKYGYFLSSEDLYPPVQFDRIELSNSQQVPIYIVAEAAKTYFKVIKDLNPQIRGYYVPAGKYPLMIPKGSSVGFLQRYEKLVQQWIAEKNDHVYTVKKGDSLSSIAASFNVTVRAIMVWNGITTANKLSPGNKLIIFSQAKKQENYKE